MLQDPDSPTAIALAFCLSFLALGIPYWILPYESLTLPNGLFHLGAPVPLLAALYLKGFCRIPLRDAILIAGAAAPAVVIARIVLEVFLVSDSHNLWPFEVLLACITGILIAGTGGIFGTLIARLRNSGHAKD